MSFNRELKILFTELLEQYLESVPSGLFKSFDKLRDAEISTSGFSFYTSVASVFSSKIEGENVDIDSFIKHKREGVLFQPDYTKKTDDLYEAYIFAGKNELNRHNFSLAHKLLSRNLLNPSFQGTYRTGNMFVADSEGKIEYVAVSPEKVGREMDKFWDDIDTLRMSDLTIEEAFYFASMIHLVFVKIHPWNDGNGRSARLLEKWFLAEKLGEKAWYLQSEKMYYTHHSLYYQNIRKLGIEYPTLDYGKALPFLLMLPGCLDAD